MPAFATTVDVETYLQRQLTNAELVAADFMLSAATSLIQGYTGQDVFHVTDDVVTLWPRGNNKVLLPQLPVTGVTSVASDGDAVTWELRRGGVLHLTGGWSNSVTVTYSHGYVTIPPAVVMACVHLATRSLTNPTSVRQESTGPFSVTYSESSGDIVGAGLSLGERQMLAPYRMAGVA
jgi:hypothetical protein